LKPCLTGFSLLKQKKMSTPVEIARAARLASVSLQSISNEQKNEALLKIKQVLSERREEIFKANEQDKKVFKSIRIYSSLSHLKTNAHCIDR
jgi:glutamate-5-semialdehyde dehydrogenase